MFQQLTDEEIVALIQRGDREKYGEIIDRYQKRLAGFIRKIIGDSDEVNDLVEESLISAYENIWGFDVSKKFSSWILRITHNKTVDFIKKKKTLMIPEDWDEPDKEQKLMEEVEIENERKLKLETALGQLELKYREVIVLYYFEEKSYEEISDVLHTTTGNVGVMIKRAREKLKKFLI